MAYCILDDVRGLNPKRTYDASSLPTSTQATAIMDAIYNEINSHLNSRGVTVPVTTPAHFVATLKQGNALGAAALTEEAMFPEAAGIGAGTHGQWLWTRYQNFLKWIDTGELPKAVDADGEPRSFFSENESDELIEDQDWRRHKIRMNMEF